LPIGQIKAIDVHVEDKSLSILTDIGFYAGMHSQNCQGRDLHIEYLEAI
jgi:hypothetical protein